MHEKKGQTPQMNSLLSPARRSRLLAGVVVAGVAAVPAAALAHVAPHRAHAAGTTLLETHTVSTYGPVLAASNGHTLYMFDRDKPNRSSCSGACARTWVPYTSSGKPAIKSGSGLNARLLGTIRISGGHLQVTYNRHPLYEYSRDRKAGASAGQAKSQFGGDWYMVGPKGKPITCQPGLICGY
jgi:predicted lipoprotein with Yx(FWY)xxD motif